MAEILFTHEPDFFASLQKRISYQNISDSNIQTTVSTILKSVQQEGDRALLRYTQTFDHHPATHISELCLNKDSLISHFNRLDPQLQQALLTARDRIITYHERQLPRDDFYEDSLGIKLGNRWNALSSVGLYVPGGRASYPSSVLMNALPAKVAGVQRLIMVVPAPQGQLSSTIMGAAYVAGIEEIYTIGGAQAIAALTFGTATIPKVQKIVGPGNAFVAEAKRQVFGMVGIDMIAGPSEILVIADQKNPPEWIAADLLSQAEHDPEARAILLTQDLDYAKEVMAAVERLLSSLPRGAIAKESWEKKGLVIIAPEESLLLQTANLIAAEHVVLAVDHPESLASQIHNAGALFLGRYSPEAIGDYTAGPSHVLPTSGTAAFSSGLSVYDFIKRTSMIHCSKEGFEAIASPTITLAEAEGLEAHALSVRVRLPS